MACSLTSYPSTRSDCCTLLTSRSERSTPVAFSKRTCARDEIDGGRAIDAEARRRRRRSRGKPSISSAGARQRRARRRTAPAGPVFRGGVSNRRSFIPDAGAVRRALGRLDASTRGQDAPRAAATWLTRRAPNPRARRVLASRVTQWPISSSSTKAVMTWATSRYEVLAGVAVEDRDLWILIPGHPGRRARPLWPARHPRREGAAPRFFAPRLLAGASVTDVDTARRAAAAAPALAGSCTAPRPAPARSPRAPPAAPCRATARGSASRRRSCSAPVRSAVVRAIVSAWPPPPTAPPRCSLASARSPHGAPIAPPALRLKPKTRRNRILARRDRTIPATTPT